MILIACGLRAEAGIFERLGLTAVAGGGDPARLEAELRARAGQATLILSAGVAGALDPALAAGAIVLGPPESSIAHYLREALPEARLGTVTGAPAIVAEASAKAALYAATRATIVDMESHIAARVARAANLPFAFARTISDRADESLPPAAQVGMRPDGKVALGRVLASLAARPGQLPALLRTAKSAGAAFKALERVAAAVAALEQKQ
ncbi:MAG: hypothetical protein A4S12_08940 [Proteobacteria bacterium SG_bin5]|nr:MAG: hypothetical protein A4S12_08940 [Proteobacteria bacterium SG_bin5]